MLMFLNYIALHILYNIFGNYLSEITDHFIFMLI